MSSQNRRPPETGRDPDLVGAEAAMRRAARVARRRAAEVSRKITEGQSTEHSDQPWPSIIVSALSGAERATVLNSLRTLCEAGSQGSTQHLRKACECINNGDWAGSIRQSIHTVESVASILAPEAKTLKSALASFEHQGALHPALKDAFIKLYGYTSDEQGLRHPLLDREKAKVGRDEAVFMLGACAFFASFLWRKHKAGDVS